MTAMPAAAGTLMLAKMRKILLAAIYLAMVGFGAAFTYFTIRMGGKLLFLFGGVFLMAFGVYLAWTDFFSRDKLKS